MKLKVLVILFCVLLYSSKIVDSNPHSAGLLRQRVNQPSIWHGNQNAQDAQYLDTDFTQTRKVNTLTNSAIQQENIQDYNVNQGRHNYNDYDYNKRSASSSSGKELLESYNLQTDGRRLESYPPRVESYPSEVGFDNQPFRKQNWRPRNLHTHSVPSAVLITDNERPLVNTVQEPYRPPVQYLQPKYAPSSNQRFYQPDRSYLTREQFQYPLANNAGDSYVANTGPHFASSGPVPYENYSEGQARGSEIKAKLTDGQRYTHNLAPQSRNYNEIPVVIATDSVTDQSENIKYLENFRSRSDLSNTASSASYEDSSPVVENYRLDSRLSNVPEPHEIYSEGQTAATEIKTRLSGDRRHTQSFAPQSGIIYNESPAVITTDTLEDQFKNIKSVGNYRSRSDISETVPTTNYNDDSPVLSAADNYNLHSSPNNGPISYESYSDAQAVVSEVNPRPIEAKRYVQNFAPQSRIIYNDIPAVIATDILADQSSNIRYEEGENYKSRSDLSSTASTTNYDDDSSVINTATAETHNEGSKPINAHVHNAKYDNSHAALSRPIGSRKYLQRVAPQSRIIHNDVPTVIAKDVLADQSNNIRYEKREDYKSRSDLINIAPEPNQDDTSPVISTVDNIDSDSKSSNPVPENIERRAPLDVKVLSDKPLSRRYADNYRSVTESSNNVFDNSFDGAPNVISETIEEKLGAYEDNKMINYRQNEPINLETSPTSTHTAPTKPKTNKIEEIDTPSYGSSIPTPSNNPNKHHTMKELNLNKFDIQNLMDGSSKPYLVIHPNGTVEHLDTIDLDSQPNTYFRLVNNERINVDDTEGEETQLPEIAPNNIAKSFVPINETPLPADTQPADYRKSLLNVNQVNSAYESDSKLPNKALPADQSNSKPSHIKQQTDGDNLNPVTPVVNQPVDEGNSKLPFFNQQEDSDKFKPLRPFIRHRIHHHKSKPTDVNQLVFDNKSNPSIPDGSLLAVEKSKHLNENQADDNDSYPSSPDENQPSDVNNANLPLTETESGNDKNSQPLRRPYKRWPHRHHYKPKLSNVNQPTENSDSSPSSNENQPLDDSNYKTLPLNENQPIVDIDSQVLNLHESKPVHHYTSKHSHLNQIRDVDIVSSLSPTENKPADDNDFNTSSPDNIKPADDTPDNTKPADDNHSKLFNDSQPGNNNKFKPIHSHYLPHHNEEKSMHENQSKHNKKYPKNKPEDDKISNSSSLDENKSTDDDIFPTNKPKEDIKSKLLNPSKRQPALHNEPKLSHKDQMKIDEIFPQNKSEDDNNSNLRSPGNNQSTDDDRSENKPEDDNKSKLLNLHKGKPTHHNKTKLSQKDQSEKVKNFPKNKPGDDYNFNSSSPDDNESIDDDTFLESQPRNNKKTKPIHQHNRKPAHHNKPKLSYEDQSENNDTFPQNKLQDGKISNLSSLDENNSTNDDIFPTNKPEEDIKSKPLSPPKRQSALHTETNLSQKDQSEIDEVSLQNNSDDDDNSNLWSPGNKQPTEHDASENKPKDNNKPKLLNLNKGKPAHHNKPKLSYEDQSENVEIYPKNKPDDDYNLNSSSPDDNESIDDDAVIENQPQNNKKTKPLHQHYKKPAHHNEPKLSYEDQTENDDTSPQNKPEYDDDSDLWFPDDNDSIEDDTFLENQQQNNKKIKPLHPQSARQNEPKPSHGNQLENDDTSSQNEPEDDVNSNTFFLDENLSEEDDTYSQNNSEDDIDSVSPLAGENESEHNKKIKPLHKNKKQPTVSKIDDQPVSTTLPLGAPNYTKLPKSQVAKKHKHRHISQKSTTTSLTVTTPCPNETPEDQIITLSPIEQVTDNVSDIPPVTTTTTTAKPIKTPGKYKKRKNNVNSPSSDFASITNKLRTPSTKASTSSLTTRKDSTSDDKTTKATVLNKKIQTNDNKGDSQVNNVKNDTQTIQSAVYDLSELLDSNTDVLAESDDNSPVIKSPSVQSDVITGDTSGANKLEFAQPETDIIITVSTDNDFEDDIITINVEVFESPGLSSNNKSLLVSIDTNNDSDDDTETPVPSDCEKDHNGVDDGRGKNLEIDLSNLKGEPTMWIRTTNQDFIDKLMNNNDTTFDMIYFFNIVNQPVIEREKVTTIHCNGTVVIETKEITYANKDDPTPTIVKTTETIQIDDYKQYGLD